MSDSVADTTRDAFLGGRVFVFQPKSGFRGGSDSVLLAAAIDADQKGEVLEFGCGSGAALLPAATRVASLAFVGLDKDREAIERAKRGVAENGFTDRVRCIVADAAALPDGFNERFDLVFSNPPFFEADRTEAPGAGKHHAYLESIDLEAWVKSMLSALRRKGTFLMIHRAAELARLLAVLEPLAGEIAVLPVRSFPGGDAKRVIIRARKGLRRGPVRLLNGIELYSEKGGPPSAIMDAISRHGDGIDWSAR